MSFCKFLIAQGSIEEYRYCLILAKDLDYRDTITLERNLEEVSRLLEAYTRRVARS
ncbi:MAG: four helix bundle protein [Dehalococcoidia bacterium]